MKDWKHHYQAAEQLLERNRHALTYEESSMLMNQAQVHATLAIAAYQNVSLDPRTEVR